jgi:hypothetical protein
VFVIMLLINLHRRHAQNAGFTKFYFDWNIFNIGDIYSSLGRTMALNTDAVIPR